MGEASGKSPLQVPEILENILGCLPLEDLKSARLVNKFWRDCGIAPMKKKASGGVHVGCLISFDGKTIHDLAELSKCLDTVAGGNANFPCSKFSFSPVLIRSDRKNRNKDESLVANFVRKISPWATKLELSTDPQKRIFKAAFPRKVDFPKLKLLRFSTCVSQYQDSKITSRAFYQFIGDIVEKAPSLQKVYFRDNCRDSVEAIIKAKSSFTEMLIYDIRNTSSMDKLSRWNREVKLKSLDLRFKSLESSQLNTSLYQLLRSQSDSLETLKLYFRNISIRVMVSFPEMPKLKNLTIQLDDDDDEDDDVDERTRDLVTFPVISYQQFPALKTLLLNPSGCEEISLCKQFIKPEMSPVETIQELTLPTDYFDDDESFLTVQNAVAIFPNVKKLNVAAHPAMLPTIFEHWTNLEEITLYSGGRCTDYLLMGHSRSGYKRLQRRIEREGEDFDWNQLEPGNTTESILNLEKLRVLRFINGAESRKLEVTRASLHLILSRMSSLRCLDFGYRCYPMETKIDKAWLSKLNEDCVVLWKE